MLSVGSLFSGVGGFDLGLERAGMRVVWQCESDDFCRRVLAKHWPDVPCFEDVSELRGADVERVDVLCGGFPCQDISLVGRGAGIDGARSGLWSEYARLVGELRPRYVVVENVAALLARGMGRVLGDLAALGYDAEWDCLPASAFGAPHRRDRLWIVAYPSGDDGRPGWARGWARRSAPSGSGQPESVGALQVADPQVITVGTGLRPDEPTGERRRRSGDCGGAVANAESGRSGARRTLQAGEAESAGGVGGSGGQWLVEPDVGRVANGIPARVDRLRSLGNALVPQIAEWIGRRIVNYETQNALQSLCVPGLPSSPDGEVSS